MSKLDDVIQAMHQDVCLTPFDEHVIDALEIISDWLGDAVDTPVPPTSAPDATPRESAEKFMTAIDELEALGGTHHGTTSELYNLCMKLRSAKTQGEINRVYAAISTLAAERSRVRKALTRLVSEKEPNGYPLWFNRTVHECNGCDYEDLCREHLAIADKDFVGCDAEVDAFVRSLLAKEGL